MNPGEQTRRALENFGEEQLPREFIRSYGETKKAALLALHDAEKFFTEEDIAVLCAVCDEIIAGVLDGEFRIPFHQGGAGTSIQMNFNESIAIRAGELHAEKYGCNRVFDPIEEINRSQSTNDVFPTALTVMISRYLADAEKWTVALQERFVGLETTYGTLLMTGRTELQDALPITFGQVFGAFAGAMERDRWRISKLRERVRTIALGGTALGTCFTASSGYIHAVEKRLREITGLSLSRSQNLPDELSNHDKYAEVAGGYSLAAQNLFKISSDLLLYSSSMVGEIIHPELQYGSTIMAAKKNPVLLELIRGLSIEIQGEAEKIRLYSQLGQFQLNANLPFITGSFVRLHRAFVNAASTLCERFLPLMRVDSERVRRNLFGSYALLNALVVKIGYNKVKELYRDFELKPSDGWDEFIRRVSTATGIGVDELGRFLDPFSLTVPEKKVKRRNDE